MIKQVLILTASVCGMALVIATMTSETSPEAVPVEPVEEVKKIPAVAASTPEEDEDYYSDEDSDFVFGEPVKYDDGEQTGATAERSEYREDPKPSRSYAAKPAPRFKNSPQPGQLGSKDNPVDLTPDRPRT